MPAGEGKREVDAPRKRQALKNPGRMDATGVSTWV